MRFARNVKNAFTVREVADITGLKPAMLNFLIRNEYLQPSYREDDDLPERQKRRPRGNTRYCSYRDLMIAKTIQRLLNAGVQLIRVKEALADLRADKHWLKKPVDASVDRAITWLVTDGRKVYLQERKNPFLEPPGNNRQKAFSFIVEMTSVHSDVRTGIRTSQIPKCREKLSHFRFANEEPIFDPPRRVGQ
jgi:DNA-binding transcriptional MerR regulator